MTEPVIAVIDPDPNFLTSINETLARSGYIAILSRGNHETEQLIDRERPSLIIIDGTMRGTDGTSGLVDSVIANATVKHIPMLVTVSHRREAFSVSGRQVEECESLSKPIDQNELESKLRAALGPLVVAQPT